jgi:hypothetical protein
MRLFQRVSAWFGWALLLGIGVLLILEGPTVIDAAWREWIGDAAVWMTQPPLAAWLAALLGVLLGLVALAILIAQFVPIRMTRASTTVERAAAGSTRVAPIVIRRAAVARLKEIDGIVDAAPFSHKKRRLSLRARMERDADASRIEQEARTALDESLWSMLGVPPERIDLTLTYSTVLAPRSTPE